MQKRHLWLVAIFALGVLLGYWWKRRSPTVTPVVHSPVTVQRSAPIAPLALAAPTAPIKPAASVPVLPKTPPRLAAPVPPPAAPAATESVPTVAAAPVPNPDVRIEENQTIDFSGGKAVVKDSTEEKAIIDAAMKEMTEATKNITFGPTAPQAAETKKAEPTAAPPK